ncbi:MAG: hypothetical protein KME26_33825 [Oscillatoria princeps RMCB-10]|nr:hypothetical protein [Oscillatoria princeps RMCB-10]
MKEGKVSQAGNETKFYFCQSLSFFLARSTSPGLMPPGRSLLKSNP